MFTVRQRDPTIGGCSGWSSITRSPGVTVGASGTLTSITSPLCRVAPARMDDTSSYLAVSSVAEPMSTRIGVVRANWIQPAGSTVTAVTCADEGGGQRRGDPEARARPWRRARCPAPPGGCGTVRSISPGGRVADSLSTRPSALSDVPAPVRLRSRRGGRLLGHLDVHAVGPRHVHRGRAHPGQLLDRRAPRHRCPRRAAAGDRPGPPVPPPGPRSRARCP